MNQPTNIAVATTGCYPVSKRASVSWELDGARFHVWIDMETKVIEKDYTHNKKSIIYKNPPAKMDRQNPLYFNTRYLDADKAVNAETVRIVFEAVERDGLIAKAIAADLEAARKQQEQNAEYARQERLKDAAPRLAAMLKRCQAALRANGAPNCEAMKESTALLIELGEAQR